MDQVNHFHNRMLAYSYKMFIWIKFAPILKYDTIKMHREGGWVEVKLHTFSVSALTKVNGQLHALVPCTHWMEIGGPLELAWSVAPKFLVFYWLNFPCNVKINVFM
jgi:hypothetical protein